MQEEYVENDGVPSMTVAAPIPRPIPPSAAGLGSFQETQGMKKGGRVKKMAKGGSASSRADGCAVKGKTKGRIV